MLICLFGAAAQGETPSRLLAGAQDLGVIDGALAAETVVAQTRITGVTIPHHILAADLIARGLRAASGQPVSQIILIGPDHFRSLETPFGVLSEPVDTVKGPLRQSDVPKALLERHGQLFADVGAAPREHAIHAIAPFIAALFPDVPVTMITTATASTQADWDAAIAALTPHLDAQSLVVQSTDYSHFLPRHMAVQRDIQTFGVIGAQNPDGVLNLTQPAHLDSKAAQYIQMSLQELIFDAQPMIVAHKDAHDYVPATHDDGPTTSYIVTLYGPDPAGLSQLTWVDHSRIVFGGDVFLDRGWQPALQTQAMDDVIADINWHRGKGPFVVNLEGVILPARPAGTNPVQHLMLNRLVIPHLEGMGVTEANLANNHAFDFGIAGHDETVSALEDVGILPLAHGEVTERHGIALLPLTFKRSYFNDHAVIRALSQLDQACQANTTLPLVVLTHWGADYSNVAGADESAVLEKLANCGVSAVIGAHSHNASQAVTVHGGGRLQAVFSMGNLLFDQTGGDVSGAFVELRLFAKGTMALRLIPIPNAFAALKDAQ